MTRAQSRICAPARSSERRQRAAVRVPVRAERDAGLVLVDADPVGAPIEPGLACLCADAPDRRGFHVLGDLDEDRGVWVLRPHRVADPVHTS